MTKTTATCRPCILSYKQTTGSWRNQSTNTTVIVANINNLHITEIVVRISFTKVSSINLEVSFVL